MSESQDERLERKMKRAGERALLDHLHGPPSVQETAQEAAREQRRIDGTAAHPKPPLGSQPDKGPT